MNATTVAGDPARTTDRVASSVRVGALAGVVGPLLFTLGFFLQEAFRHDEFSPVAEPVSALEAGPNGWIQQVNFVVFGLMILTFAFGLNRGLSPTRMGALGPALLCVAAVGLFLAAAFPLREDAAGVTYDLGFHFVARRDVLPEHIGGPAGAVASGVAGDSAPLHDYAGLAQRTVLLLVTFPCLVTLALRLRTSPAAHTSTPPEKAIQQGSTAAAAFAFENPTDLGLGRRLIRGSERA
jgi:hypothetical protein